MDTPMRDGGAPRETAHSAPEPPDSATTFTVAQLCVLLTLRRSYGPYFDSFSGREMARLRLLRWLYQTGHLAD